jgi:DNA-binding response OmpR family regulator
MRALVVEDDPVIRDAVCRALSREGYAADSVGSAEQAKSALHAEHFDLAIVDIGLPAEDGLQLLRDLRRRGNSLPVLMLTARDGLQDRVSALDLGADDYLTKPFDVPELLARCRALLRRANGVASAQIQLGALTVDLGRKELLLHGTALDITQREWSVIECLALNAGHIVSKEKLLTAVSGWGEEITPNAIEVYVSRVRAKLAGAAIIHAVRGLGYRLDEQPS